MCLQIVDAKRSSTGYKYREALQKSRIKRPRAPESRKDGAGIVFQDERGDKESAEEVCWGRGSAANYQRRCTHGTILLVPAQVTGVPEQDWHIES
jgi:hypothetical protein